MAGLDSGRIAYRRIVPINKTSHLCAAKEKSPGPGTESTSLVMQTFIAVSWFDESDPAASIAGPKLMLRKHAVRIEINLWQRSTEIFENKSTFSL